MFKKYKLFFLIDIFLILSVAAIWSLSTSSNNTESQISEPGWIQFDSDEASFSYPEKLTAEYVSTVDWPPAVALEDGAFSCTDAGSEIERAGRSEIRMVDNRVYCVTKISEGAAGSVYTQYAYAGQLNNKIAILTFSLRFPQCANYGGVQRTACENERQAFDIDGVADRMFKTLVVK